MTLDGVNRRKVTAEERAVRLKAEKWSDACGVHRGERDGRSVGKLGTAPRDRALASWGRLPETRV